MPGIIRAGFKLISEEQLKYVVLLPRDVGHSTPMPWLQTSSCPTLFTETCGLPI